MAAEANARTGTAIPRDDVDALLAARHELGNALEPEMTAAFLARVEQAVAHQAADQADAVARRTRFTQRIAWSLGLGIPLVTAGGLIGGVAAGGADGSPFGAIAGMAVTLATVIGLNVYYTEVEKELEMARLYRRRR